MIIIIFFKLVFFIHETFHSDTFSQKHGRCPSVQSFLFLSQRMLLSPSSRSLSLNGFHPFKFQKEICKKTNKHGFSYKTKNTLSQSSMKKKGEEETFLCWRNSRRVKWITLIGPFSKFHFHNNEVEEKESMKNASSDATQSCRKEEWGGE